MKTEHVFWGHNGDTVQIMRWPVSTNVQGIRQIKFK